MYAFYSLLRLYHSLVCSQQYERNWPFALSTPPLPFLQARRGIEDTTKEEEEAEAKKAAEDEAEAAKKAEKQRLYEDQLDLARRAKIREWDQGKEATLQADKEGI